MIPISIYSSAFNLLKNNFTYAFDSIFKFCEFANEVVIAVNTSEDDTLQNIKDFKAVNSFNHLKIIETNFSYDDPLLDGKIKNAALKACSNEIVIQLDMDEYIPLWQKGLWNAYAEYLLSEDMVKAVLVPSLNLYKDWDHYKDVGQKWYIHKKEGLNRGPVRWARNVDGTVNTQKSDTCELIDNNGDLVFSYPITMDWEAAVKKEIPFVVHWGYVSLENRVLRNQNFWKSHWLRESGGKMPPHKVHMTTDDFINETARKHHLDIS